MHPIPFPQPDPTPLPLPFGVLKALLLITFGLHVFAVNVGVGGSILCVGLALRARRPGSAALAQIARTIAYVLPPAVTFAITLGVAPLLFIQLLYGEVIYTSTILLAAPWVLFIFLLMAGYTLLYRFTDGLKAGKPSLPVGIVSTLLLLSIGFLWTNNVTLMIAPERWSDLHLAAPHGGALNLGDPAVVPRFLHMSTAMLAVAGILLAGLSVELEDDAHFDRALGRRIGLSVFAYATLGQIVVGPTTLLLQRADVRGALLGGSKAATAALATGVICGMAAMITAFRGRDPATGKNGVRLPLGLLIGAIGGMVLVRDFVRDFSLARHGYAAGNVATATDVAGTAALVAALVAWLVATRAMFSWVFAKKRIEPTLALEPAIPAPARPLPAAFTRTLASAEDSSREGAPTSRRSRGKKGGKRDG